MLSIVTTLAAACTNQLCLDSLPKASASSSTVQTVIQITLSVFGAIALLMITIGGFRYVVSRGDPQAVAKAKNTILYAVIGLVVALMAQVIVIFVTKAL